MYNTATLLLYMDILDIDEYFRAQRYLKTSKSKIRIAASKCGFVLDSIIYLISPTKTASKKNILTFNINMFYAIYIEEIDAYRKQNCVGHAFGIFYEYNTQKWKIIDGYIGLRECSIRDVEISDVIHLCGGNRNYYESVCGVSIENTVLLSSADVFETPICLLYECLNTYNKLVDLATNRLNNEQIGLSDDHLFLLSGKCDKFEAKRNLSGMKV